MISLCRLKLVTTDPKKKIERPSLVADEKYKVTEEDLNFRSNVGSRT